MNDAMTVRQLFGLYYISHLAWLLPLLFCGYWVQFRLLTFLGNGVMGFASLRIASSGAESLKGLS